jgi:trehalose 6-phosphate phosphatase
MLSSGAAELLQAMRVHAADALLAVVDFDGVLTEYHADADAVTLTAHRRDVLTRVAKVPGITLAIISGRPVDDLVARTGLAADVFHLGLHGLESVGPGFAHVRHDVLEVSRTRLHELAVDLEPSVATVSGARLEDKNGAIALHTRDVDSSDTIWLRFHLLSAAADLLAGGTLRAVRGRDVLELLPNVADPRAGAIEAVRAFVEARDGRSTFTVYIGADAVDDDARHAVQQRGLAAVVGRRVPGTPLHLADGADLEELLERFVTDWRGRPDDAGVRSPV